MSLVLSSSLLFCPQLPPSPLARSTNIISNPPTPHLVSLSLNPIFTSYSVHPLFFRRRVLLSNLEADCIASLLLRFQCNAIHKEIAKNFKSALVFGTSVKHSRGQKVGLDHVLEDEE